jgi:hypothetical protein
MNDTTAKSYLHEVFGRMRDSGIGIRGSAFARNRPLAFYDRGPHTPTGQKKTGDCSNLYEGGPIDAACQPSIGGRSRDRRSRLRNASLSASDSPRIHTLHASYGNIQLSTCTISPICCLTSCSYIGFRLINLLRYLGEQRRRRSSTPRNTASTRCSASR